MLTAKVCVRYEGDWTSELEGYDVFAEFLASTFRNRRYIGIIALETSSFESVLTIIENHQSVGIVDVIERYNSKTTEKTAATVLLHGKLTESTPLQILISEGFLPLGPTKLENGQECFDLLLENRDDLSKATSLLREFGSVSVERISQEFRRQVVPSEAEWQELLSSIPSRQRELLNKAVEHGYFNIPREITLEELAGSMGITKTTASNHLRKAERQIINYILPYINLAMSDQ